MVDTAEASPEGRPNKDIRLALVLNGGVSLAVWMGGVAHELDLLRRASGSGSPEPVPENEAPVFEIWKELASNAKASVTIDVISGTSAGGLNGMLLATAIGRGTALTGLRKLWRDSAALNSLVGSPPTKPTYQNSVLSGKRLRELAEIALNDINDGALSLQEPITLFVTATALDGKSRPFKDSFGNHFDIRDHRRVYRFQHDRSAVTYKQIKGGWHLEINPSKNDFHRENNNALAQAACATASYPVAFPPVSEYPLMEYRHLPRPHSGYPASCVIDGGVLNNAPFEPVLEEITKREIDKPVERVVIYIVPSAGKMEQESTAHQEGEEISWLTTLLNAIQYPQEANLRSGTETLFSQLSRGVRDKHLDLFGRMREDKGLSSTLLSAAHGLFEEYRRNRVESMIWESYQRSADTGSVTSLASTPEAQAEEIRDIFSRIPLNWCPSSPSEICKPNLAEWGWGIVTAERVLQTLSSHLHEQLKASENLARRKILIEGALTVSKLLRDAIAVLDAAWSQLRHRVAPTNSYTEAAVKLNKLSMEMRIPKTLGKLVTEASESYLETMRKADLELHWETPEQVVSACLALEVVTQAFAPPEKVVRQLSPKFKFLRLGPDSTSPLFNEDRFADMGDQKLYGIRFQHFGAFIDRDWRASDFVWGRLDAAHHLLCLFDLDDETREDTERRLHQAILDAEDHSREEMTKNLADLLQCDGDLMKGIYAKRSGKDTARTLSNSIVRLLSAHPPKNAARTTGVADKVRPHWQKFIRIARPVFVAEEKQLEQHERNLPLRILTCHIRKRTRSAYEDDVTQAPKAFFRSALRTAAVLLLISFVVGRLMNLRKRWQQIRFTLLSWLARGLADEPDRSDP
ncbi:DUF3376 domain-containing protein [Streptosporangium carneum]|uniref:PNPLA domain-containing protein n=1 Tax=Streptosporangium carneum TaxID=47481 RepID=A0A9W6I9Y3_9ACTN|nr:DUF3376 domain-containing protein [Streptosporangium carneum]GLK14821.1 hypothetical protein GCM10017600_82330 [Streptosporangium carneum]